MATTTDAGPGWAGMVTVFLSLMDPVLPFTPEPAGAPLPPRDPEPAHDAAAAPRPTPSAR